MFILIFVLILWDIKLVKLNFITHWQNLLQIFFSYYVTVRNMVEPCGESDGDSGCQASQISKSNEVAHEWKYITSQMSAINGEMVICVRAEMAQQMLLAKYVPLYLFEIWTLVF